MAATQTVTWTVLPNGVRDGRLYLSIYARPRLAGDVTLGAFPDWVDWPAKDVAFLVKIGADPTGVQARAEGPARRSDLWAKLFTTGTKVGAADVDVQALAAPQVRSVPIVTLRDFTKKEYAKAAANYATTPPGLIGYVRGGGLAGEVAPQGGSLPPTIDLLDLRLTPSEKEQVRNEIRTRLNTQGYFLGGKLTCPVGPLGTTFQASEEQVNFLLLEQFHTRNRDNNHVPTPEPPPAVRQIDEPAEQLEFHTVLGHLSEYPTLLRLFGIVRDISIPVPTDLPSGPVDVQVTATWPHTGADPNLYTVTSCLVTATSFQPVAGPDAAISTGLYDLSDPDLFDLTELDTDGIASKVLSFAETINSSTSYNFATPLPPPSIESRGLGLSRRDRAKFLHGQLLKAIGLVANVSSKTLAASPLVAEDITRGFRLDVWDSETNKWHSLCLRKGRYHLDGTTLTIDDEGTIESAHTEQENDDTLYLHESLARWVGYSLVVPRPGKATAGDDDTDLVDGDTEAGDVFNLKTSFKAAPGSLPKLRFGRGYRMRARTVDLAGNSLQHTDLPADDFSKATREVTYRRFEPVPSPNLLLRKPRTEGESPELMVVRSNYNKPSTADTQRHVLPDKAAQMMAEQHGMFDVPKSILNPGGMSRAAYQGIAEKDPGTLATSGQPDPGGNDVRYYDTDHLSLPYLPDPMARGAAFQGLPGTQDVVTVDFDYSLLHKWPDARPFRIRLVEGTGAPSWSSLQRVLTVQMPKGRVARIRYSSRIDADDRDLFGAWAWLVEYLADPANERPDGVTLEAVKQWAVKGRLWMLTPYRTLTLVHAIRQPLTPPAFSKPIALRMIGDTTAKIVDKITVDNPSTSKVDLVATWTEPVDVVTQPEPQIVTGQGLAYDIDVDSDDETNAPIPIGKLHELHDTKYRKVDYELVASTRYAEYFTEHKTVTLIAENTPVSAAGIAPGTDVVRSTANAGTSFRRDADYSVNYAAGTITPLTGGTLKAGDSVDVAFVAPPITRSSTEAKPRPSVDVPSSARPIAPDVAYAVPTFGWAKTSSATQIASTRSGSGLRVYVQRPWYSSGDGEQLGVVVPQVQPDEATLARLERYVTTWGQDPVFRSGASDPGLLGAPQRGQFPLAIRPKSNLKLAESDRDLSLTDRVAVAPHNVGFDKDRQLWYSDITINRIDTAYTPFIRLALARYQPISVTGVELSTVVLAQFAQLSPDRTMTVVFDAADATKVNVTVVGKTYAQVPGKTTTAELTVLVQTADPGLQGELAWSTTGQPVELGYTANPDKWSGTVTLPAARGTQPFRLVVEENELLMGATPTPRLVYLDAVQI